MRGIVPCPLYNTRKVGFNAPISDLLDLDIQRYVMSYCLIVQSMNMLSEKKSKSLFRIYVK